MNPKMITLARELRGKTQSQLAAEIDGLTQGNLSRIEKGILNVTDELSHKFSQNLDFPLSFFKKEHVKTPISEFYYRKRANIPKKTITSLEATLDLYRLIVDTLLESIEIPEFKLSQFDLEHRGTPEQAARKIRQELKLEKGPIENLISVIERNGIIIIEIPSSTDKFDGITTLTDGGQPIIFINKSFPNDRKRFTIAHELGHLILHIPFNISNERDEEDEANRFAGEFSIPELDSFNQLLNLRFSDLGNAKRYWNMSMAFIIRRATDIKAITKNKGKNFIIELSRRGWRKKEPINVYLDNPRLLQLLVKSHFEDLDYKETELIDVLGLSITDFNNFLRPKNRIVHLRRQ